MDKIKIGILGYGNLGRGVESGIRQNDDMVLAHIITRRDKNSIKTNTEGVAVSHIDELKSLKEDIDVLILCGGSMSDLPKMAPYVAGEFNTVDGFDTHAKIPEYFASIDKNAKKGSKASIIASGWDPGLFSMNRLIARAFLPKGNDATFWGSGVSQGHSDAIRRIKGVIDARQYTIPIEKAVELARHSDASALTAREKHLRKCYVVAKEGADKERISEEIKTMPNYFADYDTEVHFISATEMNEKHNKLPHGGFVIRNGLTGFNEENKELMEFKLKLSSNPEFTASILLAYARAVCRMNKEGKKGAFTVFDVPLSYLINMPYKELIATLL